MRRSVDFWYFLISLKATVPGLNLWGFLTPVVTGALFLAIFWATSCFLGTFCAVDFLAVCFVLAIVVFIILSHLFITYTAINPLILMDYSDWLKFIQHIFHPTKSLLE